MYTINVYWYYINVNIIVIKYHTYLLMHKNNNVLKKNDLIIRRAAHFTSFTGNPHNLHDQKKKKMYIYIYINLTDVINVKIDTLSSHHQYSIHSDFEIPNL